MSLLENIERNARSYYRFPHTSDEMGMILVSDPDEENGIIAAGAGYISIGNLPPGQWQTGYEPGTQNAGLVAPEDKLDTVAEILQKYGHREQPVAGKPRPVLVTAIK